MLSTVEKVLFLKSVDLFSKIPGEDLAQVAGIAQEVTFENEELIIQEGEMGDSMFLIIDGEVLVHREGTQIAKVHNHGCVHTFIKKTRRSKTGCLAMQTLITVTSYSPITDTIHKWVAPIAPSDCTEKEWEKIHGADSLKLNWLSCVEEVCELNGFSVSEGMWTEELISNIRETFGDR